MDKNTNPNDGPLFVSLRAIDQYLEDQIVKPIETPTARGFISWGKNNEFPDYLLGLRKNVSTLRALEDGLRDYIVGDGLNINVAQFQD